MRFSLKVAAAAAILAMPAAASAQYTLYVGYADELRSGGFFPSPWSGDPGVQFFTGYSGAAPDAGAIMVQNTGPLTIFIQALMYSLTSPADVDGHYNYDFAPFIPGGGFALSPGQFAIFTGQNNTGDFDTSDFGVAAGTIGPNNPCGTPNPNAPHLTLTVDGVTTGYDDTGKILDTGGQDQATCGLDGRFNEAFGWRPIGTTGINVGTNQVAPEPSTIVLTASGLAVLGGYVRRRRAAQA